MAIVAGIDVSKATLDVSISEGPVLHFENSCRGIRSLLKHLDQAGATNAVCESTGGYERLLVRSLNATLLTVQVAHPLRVRAFARACGYEAKTDPLDAQVLSRYGLVFPESGTNRQEVDEKREELQLLLSRRRQLVEQRVQERSRLDKGISASVGKSTRRHIIWLDKEIERLDKEYKELLKRSANLCRQADLYRSVPGVGQLTAAMLVAFLPELGQRDGKALTSLVGLPRGLGTVATSAVIGRSGAVVPQSAGCCIWLLCQ